MVSKIDITFPIEQQIDDLIYKYEQLVDFVKEAGDPVCCSQLMKAKLYELKQLKRYRGSDLFKITKILESFLNHAGYDSSDKEVVLCISDVTDCRLYVESISRKLLIHMLYNLKEDRILDEVVAYGQDRSGAWGWMYMIGSHIRPFKVLNGLSNV